MSQSDQILINEYLKNISDAFIKAKLNGMCLYGSVLLKEKLSHEGILVKLVAGYLQTSQELFRHVWLEDQRGQIYDIGWRIYECLMTDSKVRPSYHRKLPSQMTRTDLLTFDQQRLARDLEHGIELYSSNPYGFWSEFDGCDRQEMKSLRIVVNQIRDSFLDS